MLTLNNKNEIKEFVENTKVKILEGEIQPLKALKQLKMVEKAVTQLLKDGKIESAIMDDAMNYHKQELAELYGCKFEIRSTGVKYKYDDAILSDLEKDKAEIEKKIKERQDILKRIPSGESYYDTSTGEELRGAVKSSKEKVFITI